MGITSTTIIPRQAPFGLKDQWWYRSSLLFPLCHIPLPHLFFFLVLFTQKKASVMNRNISFYFQCFTLRNMYAEITVTHVHSLPISFWSPCHPDLTQHLSLSCPLFSFLPTIEIYWSRVLSPNLLFLFGS